MKTGKTLVESYSRFCAKFRGEAATRGEKLSTIVAPWQTLDLGRLVGSAIEASTRDCLVRVRLLTQPRWTTPTRAVTSAT